ncbi:hypothetical protein QFC19_002637 [Naganishia cerealis]|uniref:Uncharacterized protein n=1 Tax=Naganishia cerealis TaxID=610337 RepID=A0ACC2W9K4_9TREE|nr:hypothetical protein QFC19_002637 [Naganishia cerealis]
MGVSLSTAKVITTSTFLYDFLVQQWAIVISKPDMKVVNDRNPGAFSPMPYFIGGYFFPQQILQAFWLREFFRPATMGACLVYDAVGVSIGQYQLANKTVGSYGGGGGKGWAQLMATTAAVTAAVVAMRYQIDQRFV